MLSLKATVLLGAPLLAAASEIIPSRIQRRAALLELLEHQHDKRQSSEDYGQPDICNPDAGNNDASFFPLAAGGRFADNAYAFTYASTNPQCVTVGNCQSACIADAATCFGYTYSNGGGNPVCTLYGGVAYGGPAITTVPAGFSLLQNAGTTEEGADTCATKGTGNAALDFVDPTTGACTCGAGRSAGSNGFVCMPNNVSPGSVSPPKGLSKPVTFGVPVSWSYGIQAVPAVLTATQCAAICLADSKCEAFLLNPGSELSTCWKFALAGVYDSPAESDPRTPAGARLAKRQGGFSFGGAGDIFGELPGSPLVNDADAPEPSQRARMMRTKRGHNHSQW